jgi:transcriptional regulator with AAA-type ATPase domain
VPAHTIEVLVRSACRLVSEELTTPGERNDAIRRLRNLAWTCVGTRQLLHSQRATNPLGHPLAPDDIWIELAKVCYFTFVGEYTLPRHYYFREDLFYRLGVFDVQIPPLRDRSSDVLPLSETFLQEIGRSFGRPPAGLTRDARHALLRHDWPGNVRELRNVLERASILCEGGLIDTSHLTLESSAKSHPNDTTDLNAVERTMIEKVLRECRGNKTMTARRLGLSRTKLHIRIRKHRLEETGSA